MVFQFAIFKIYYLSKLDFEDPKVKEAVYCDIFSVTKASCTIQH